MPFRRRAKSGPEAAAARPSLAPLPDVDPSNVAQLVAAYAARLQRGIAGHSVASPLGIWLLVALCAWAATGEDKQQMERVLGCSAEQAAQHARALLDAPRSGVAAALALWSQGHSRSARYADWLRTLPHAVETGPVPTNAAADEWAASHTHRIIERFPAVIQPDTELILASALATKIEWESPFTLVPSSELAASPWRSTVSQVLRAPASHRKLVLHTHAGTVGVHAARSSGNDLLVVSVITAPDTPPPVVLAVAHDAAIWLHNPAVAPHIAAQSLFDLPLSDIGWLAVTQEDTASGGRSESFDALLPAWTCESKLQLDQIPESGAAVALRVITELLELGPADTDAVQVAKASFTRLGFEAAAVSAFSFAPTGMAPSPGVSRHAELRFGHPYAVVALALDPGDPSRGVPAGAWDGLPAFSAWITEPGEPA